MGQVLGHLLGTLGPSGFGSKSTAEDVIENVELHSKTVIITGAFVSLPSSSPCNALLLLQNIFCCILLFM